jgi:hypothetical protein
MAELLPQSFAKNDLGWVCGRMVDKHDELLLWFVVARPGITLARAAGPLDSGGLASAPSA